MDDKMGAVLERIRTLLAQDIAYPIDGTFLYVEAWPGMIDISIFKDLGDRLLFRFSTDGLGDTLLELWNAAPPDKRWASMQYRVVDGTFQVSFTYDPIDPAGHGFERRDAILQQRYRNKQIVYPPPPDGLAPYTPPS